MAVFVLRKIDKQRYNRRVKLVFAGIVVALALLALLFSTLYIRLFSTPEADHFWHNLAGVVTAAVVVVWGLNRLRGHPWLDEVAYVWDLKQMLNRIYRKQKKIEAAAEQGDRNAMKILDFQLEGSRQLYHLDDNTITMDALMIKLEANKRRMEAAGLDTSSPELDPALLDLY